jgi:hypothetical protein
MTRLLLALACATLTLTVQGQPTPDRTLAAILSFETQRTRGALVDWDGGPLDTILADDKVVHSGQWSIQINRTATSRNQFSAINRSVPVDFAGARVELRGFLRTEDVSDFAGLWMREDGESPGASVAFDNMQSAG